jgi:VanZ family protein
MKPDDRFPVLPSPFPPAQFLARAWAPACLWLAVIGWQSVFLNAGETGRFLIPLLHALFPQATTQQLAALHALLRKTGHFFGYALLSFFLYRACWATLRSRRGPAAAYPAVVLWGSAWSLRAAVLALLGTMAVAAMDELQQSFRRNRSASAGDVLLDSAGGFFAQMMILAASRIYEIHANRYPAVRDRPAE